MHHRNDFEYSVITSPKEMSFNGTVSVESSDIGLVLAALDSRGLYYAVQTLIKLLDGQFHNGSVNIPLVTITDWTDLEYREIRDIRFI